MKKEKKQKTYKGMKIRKKKLDVFSFFTTLLAVAVGLEVVIGTAGLLTVNKLMESAPELDVQELYSQESTRIFDKDGKQISDVGEQLRENISYNEVPESLIDAFLSIEDSRYFAHNGFDISRFAAAALSNLRSGSADQGGSTFTMQLVKLSYFFTDNGSTSRERNIEYKVQQIGLSLALEKQASKKEIFELYLNKMNFGGTGNIRGVEKASEFYFNKRVSQLNLSESALLAGIINSPYFYDPYNFLDYSTERRNQVLDMMLRHGYVTEDEYYLARSVKVEDLLYDHANDEKTGVDPNQAYIDQVLLEAQAITGQDPLTMAMDISTAMDPKAQALSAQICAGEIPDVQYPADQVEVGFVSMNNQTGEVVAIGGGRNYAGGGSMLLNHGTSTYHSPGSCVKPFIPYALAFENLGWATSHVITDKPVGDATHVFSNFDGVYRGDVTLEYAIQVSLNTTAIQALDEEIKTMGFDKVTEYVGKLGFSQFKPEIFDLAWAIGGNEFIASPEEIAGAHSMVMNQGEFIKPHCIKKISFRSGRQDPIITAEQDAYKPVRALSAQAAYLTADMMNKVVNSPEYNYAQVLKRDYMTFAKSGTSDWGDAGVQYGIPVGARKDKWMVCSTTQYTVAAWTGFDKAEAGVQTWFSDAWDSMNTPGIICSLMIDSVTGDSHPEDLQKPDGISEITHIKGIFPYTTPLDGMDPQYITKGLIKSGYATLKDPQSAEAVENITVDEFSAGMADDENTISIKWPEYPNPSKLEIAPPTKDISLKIGDSVIKGATGKRMFDYSWVFGPMQYKATVEQNGQVIGNISSNSPSASQAIEGLQPETQTEVCGFYGYEKIGGMSANKACVAFTTPEAKIQVPSGGSLSEIKDWARNNGLRISSIKKTLGEGAPIITLDGNNITGSKLKHSELSHGKIAVEVFLSDIDD